MKRVLLVLGLLVVAAGCPKDKAESLPVSHGQGPAPYDPGQPYHPQVTAADLTANLTNTYFPAPTGASWTYRAQTDEGVERTEVSADGTTHDVWGVTALVVRDTVYLNDQMIEDTHDWFAQDSNGNVWYLGEDTAEYQNGQLASTHGTWASGADVAGIGVNALPGVQMLATPKVGDAYRQEYYPGEAEDLGVVVELDVSVTVPAGSFSGCIRTNDRDALHAAVSEYKTYCPGIGVVLEDEGDERVELISYSGL